MLKNTKTSKALSSINISQKNRNILQQLLEMFSCDWISDGFSPCQLPHDLMASFCSKLSVIFVLEWALEFQPEQQQSDSDNETT